MVIDRDIWNINEMIENQGFLAFHGSPQKITKFNIDNIGKEDAVDQEGVGIYFTTSYNDAVGYANNDGYVHTVKLSPRKLLDESSSDNMNIDSLIWLIKQAENWEDIAMNWNEDPESGVEMAAESAIDYNKKEKDVFLQIWIDFFRYDPKTYVRSMVKLGIDGLIVDRIDDGKPSKHIIIYNPDIIEIRDIEKANELEEDLNYEDELMNYVDSNEINDGGFAAPQPQKVSEDIKNYNFKNVGYNAIRNAITYIRNFDYNKIDDLISRSDLKELYNSYMIASQNIEDALRLSDNEVRFFNKLINIQEYLKKSNVIDEDLVYWGSDDGDEDETTLGIVNEDNEVTAFSKQTAQEIADFVTSKKNLGIAKYIGEGTFGYAFDLGNQVLKVTSDKSEATDALEIKGHKNERIADIYNVFIINGKDRKGEEKEFFVILLEKLDTSKVNDIKTRYINLNNLLEDNYEGQGIPSIVVDEYIHDRYLWDKEVEDDIDFILKDHPEDLKFLYELLAIADEVRSKGIDSTDFLNTENLGYKPSGKLGFFDIGFGDYFKKPSQDFERLKMEGGTSLYTNAQGTVNAGDVAWDLQEMDELDKQLDAICERIQTWMPKAKSVTIKKSCQLGGKGDGTSDACDQGDIGNIEIHDINDDNKGRREANSINVAEEEEKKKHYFSMDESLVPSMYEGLDLKNKTPYGRNFEYSVKEDRFIHITTKENADKIIKDGGLKRIGSEPISALSMMYGKYEIDTRDTNNMLGITFRTDTPPTHGHIEEVVWKKDDFVMFKDYQVLPIGQAMITLKARRKYILAPNDLVTYEENEDNRYYNEKNKKSTLK